MITDLGRLHIKRFLAGHVGVIADSVAFGLGSTAASTGDTRLNFEFERAAVTLVSYDFINDRLVFKAEMPEEVGGTVYEVGIWSTEQDSRDGGYGSKIISTFDSDTEDWVGGTFTTTARVGDDALLLAPLASATANALLEDVALDLSGYSDADRFLLAYNVGNANTSAVRFRFLTDSSNYFTYTITAPSAGYKISDLAKSAAVVTGTPDWAEINSLQVEVVATGTGSASVTLDGLRIEDTDTNNPDYVLVARQVLGIPFQKEEGRTQEVEFSLAVNISG